MRLRYLRVKGDRGKGIMKPCAEELQNLISCWRISGIENAACEGAAKALAQCTATSVYFSSNCAIIGCC